MAYRTLWRRHLQNLSTAVMLLAIVGALVVSSCAGDGELDDSLTGEDTSSVRNLPNRFDEVLLMEEEIANGAVLAVIEVAQPDQIETASLPSIPKDDAQLHFETQLRYIDQRLGGRVEGELRPSNRRWTSAGVYWEDEVSGMPQRIAILGAGLAGLSAAWGLVARGYEVEVFERDDVVGGLAKSVSYQGFTFDIGPHRFLAPPGSRVLQLVQELLGDDLRVRQRQSRILKDGKYLDYPLKAKNLFAHTAFATNLAALGSFLRSRLRWHLQSPPDTHFEHWIVNRFGNALYEAHFRNYTTKLWGLPPTDISADWAAERISQLTLWDIMQALVWPTRHPPRTSATTFHYPLGGIGTIADRLAHAIQKSGGTIALCTEVTGIETQSEQVIAVRWQDRVSGQEGRTEVDGVISTLPLPHLARMCSRNSDLDPAIDGLRYRSLVLVNVLVKREWLTGDHWLYVPDDQYLFNRLSEPKRFSPQLAPAEWTSVCAEITCDPGDTVWRADPDVLLERVAKSLAQLGLLHMTEVCGGFVTREPHEYPIYTLKYREHRDTLLAYLGRFANLQTIGRQGRFQYNNMDHAMEMGLAAADILSENPASPVFTISRNKE